MSQAAENVKNQLFSQVPQPITDEAAKQRSEDAVSSLTTYADGNGVGLKMLSSMGFGAEGLGLGKNAQVCSQFTCEDSDNFWSLQLFYTNTHTPCGLDFSKFSTSHQSGLANLPESFGCYGKFSSQDRGILREKGSFSEMQELLQGITKPVVANKLAQGVGLGYEASSKRRRMGNGPPGFEISDGIPLSPPSSPSRCSHRPNLSIFPISDRTREHLHRKPTSGVCLFAVYSFTQNTIIGNTAGRVGQQIQSTRVSLHASHLEMLAEASHSSPSAISIFIYQQTSVTSRLCGQNPHPALLCQI